MATLQQIIRDLYSFYLCVKSVPSSFMNNKNNAKYHLKYICPACPETRRITRDVENCRECWWKSSWEQSKYTIPRNFGLNNYIRASFGLPTKLDRFKK